MALTADTAKSIWRYEPLTGHFYWLLSPKYDVAIGSKAGWFDGKYYRLSYKGKRYKCSRVAWLITYGEWPAEQIDHINGIKSDDRIENLRKATNAQNACNALAKSSSYLGLRGISKKRYGYQVLLGKNGGTVYVGHFKTIEAATAARDSAARELHGDFARL